jgi:hypothetical protein
LGEEEKATRKDRKRAPDIKDGLEGVLITMRVSVKL